MKRLSLVCVISLFGAGTAQPCDLATSSVVGALVCCACSSHSVVSEEQWNACTECLRKEGEALREACCDWTDDSELINALYEKERKEERDYIEGLLAAQEDHVQQSPRQYSMEEVAAAGENAEVQRMNDELAFLMIKAERYGRRKRVTDWRRVHPLLVSPSL